MAEYTKVNVKLSDIQRKKLKDAASNTGTTLTISLKMFNGNNLLLELLLTTRQKTKIRNAFNNNNRSTDLKLSKAKINKIIQSGEFLGKLFGPLLKTRLPLIKNVIKPLAKSVLIPLGLTAAASAADARIHKKILGSGTTTLIISNEDINDIIKILQAIEDSNVLLKGVTETVKNGTKRRISKYVTRYSRCKFIRKFIGWKRNFKSWVWQ